MLIPILASILVSLLSLSALILLSLFRGRTLHRFTFILISLAAGTFLGDALLHLLPEAIDGSTETLGIFAFTLVGILSFFIFEKFVSVHEHTEHVEDHKEPEKVNRALVLNNIIGDSLHNFLDGIAIAASFAIGFPVGIATTIAILTHELPQELAEYGVLVHAGVRKKHALFLNFISGLLAVAGVLAFWVLGDSIEGIEPYILSFTAGIFVYIATADLFPEIHKDNSKRLHFLQIGFVLLGVLLMLLLRLID